MKALKEEGNLSICLISMCDVEAIENNDERNLCYKNTVGAMKIIRACTRQSDFIVKLRNSEFLVVFQDTDVEQAEKVWERIEEINSYSNFIENKSYLICISDGNAIYDFEFCCEADRIYFEELRQQSMLCFDLD